MSNNVFRQVFFLCYSSFDKSKLTNVKRKYCGLDIFFLRVNLASFDISRLTSSSEHRKHSASRVLGCCTNSCLNKKITSFRMLCGHQLVNTVFLICGTNSFSQGEMSEECILLLFDFTVFFKIFLTSIHR